MNRFEFVWVDCIWKCMDVLSYNHIMKLIGEYFSCCYYAGCVTSIWSPPVEDYPAPPCEILPIVQTIATHEYQTSFINSRGPNSKGVLYVVCWIGWCWHDLCPSIGHDYYCASLIEQAGCWPQYVLSLDGSTPPYGPLGITRPITTHESKLHLSNQEAPIQEVLVFCVWDWLTLPKPLSFNQVNPFWKPQNITTSLMDFFFKFKCFPCLYLKFDWS